MKKEKGILGFLEKAVWIFAAPMILVIIWQLSANAGILNASIMPSPKKLYTTLIDMLANGKLWRNFSVSMLRVLQGFAVGTLAGVFGGVIMGFFPIVDRALNSLRGILMPIPMIGWVPLLILWVGIGEGSKVIVIGIGTFWSVLMSTIDGIKNVSRKYVEVAEILEKGKLATCLRVILPAAMPSIITGIRLGFGNAWKAVISAEMIAASRGLGFMIQYAREMSQPAIMLVGLFTIGFVGVLIDYVFLALQKSVLQWNY